MTSMPDWDRVANAADHGAAADIGELVRRFEAGRLESYLLVYEWRDETGRVVTIAYEADQGFGALGMAVHAQRVISDSYQEAEFQE